MIKAFNLFLSLIILIRELKLMDIEFDNSINNQGDIV